jgi:hypothetical protein
MLLSIVAPIVIIMLFFIKFGSKLHTILNSYDWIDIDILFERSLRPQKEAPG